MPAPQTAAALARFRHAIADVRRKQRAVLQSLEDESILATVSKKQDRISRAK